MRFLAIYWAFAFSLHGTIAATSFAPTPETVVKSYDMVSSFTPLLKPNSNCMMYKTIQS